MSGPQIAVLIWLPLGAVYSVINTLVNKSRESHTMQVVLVFCNIAGPIILALILSAGGFW